MRTGWIGVGLLAALGAIAVLQQNAVSQLRQEHQSLLALQHETARLSAENDAIRQLDLEQVDLQPLREANRDLLRLRNEVRQLRGQKPDLERIRAENERLAAAIQTNAAGGPRLGEKEGYVVRDTWRYLGFATPEAALQTFLWALREENFAQIRTCMTPEGASAFDKALDPQTGNPPAHVLESMRFLSGIKGFRIAEQHALDEDKISLSVQATVGGEVLPVPVHRVGQEWKVALWLN